MSDRPLWLVLGAGSSIARAFARVAAESGADLILAGRDVADIERTASDAHIRSGGRAETHFFDAVDSTNHDALVAALPDRAFNVLLAFGLLLPQDAAERDPAVAERMIAVNYTGAVSILTLLAPRMAERGEGAIVVLSSVAGDRGRPSNFIYGSAKAGLNAYLEGLRTRLSGSGVSVTTVKAGFIDTPMTYGMARLFLVASPEACARACLGYAARRRRVVYFPLFWRFVMMAVRAIPERMFQRLHI